MVGTSTYHFNQHLSIFTIAKPYLFTISVGQLGIGKITEPQFRLRSVHFDRYSQDDTDHAIKIACTRNMSIVLTKRGKLFTFGEDIFGVTHASGTRSSDRNSTIPRPTKVPSKFFRNHRIVDVACGWHHVLCLDDSGTVWVAGDLSRRQVGSSIPGHATRTPVRLAWHAPISNIFCGFYTSILVERKDNRVWTAGYSLWQNSAEFTQLQFPQETAHLLTDDTKFRVKQVSCGESHIVVVFENCMRTREQQQQMLEMQQVAQWTNVDVVTALAE